MKFERVIRRLRTSSCASTQLAAKAAETEYALLVSKEESLRAIIRGVLFALILTSLLLHHEPTPQSSDLDPAISSLANTLGSIRITNLKESHKLTESGFELSSEVRRNLDRTWTMEDKENQGIREEAAFGCGLINVVLVLIMIWFFSG